MLELLVIRGHHIRRYQEVSIIIMRKNIAVYNEVKYGEKLDEQELAKFVMKIARSESEKVMTTAKRPGEGYR